MATYRKAVLIYNPYAGRIRGRHRVVEDSLDRMRQAGHSVKAVSTTGPGTGSEIAARCIAHEADLIVVAGGDGTINEVANGMIHSRVPLAILPGGTANVLASETGIGKSIPAAVDALQDWVPERISVGFHHDGFERPSRYFLLMAGIGLDAHIVYHLNASIKAAMGKAAYWLGGFSQLGRRFPEFDVEANGKSYRASFALISRVRNYGGDLDIAPSVSLLDRDFELVLFSGENSFHYLRYLVGVVSGQLEGIEGITVIQSDLVKLSAPDDRRIYTQIDGEYAGPLPVTVEIVPEALTLLLPLRYRHRQNDSAREWTTLHTR